MTKKNKNILLYGGLAVVGAGVVITTIVLVSGGKKSNISLKTAERQPTPSPTPQTPSSSQSSYTPPASQYPPPSGYTKEDVRILQAYLYKYYPKIIQSIGDIGTYGKPDGEWGNNTKAVVNSLMSYTRGYCAWASVAMLFDYAKRGKAPEDYCISGLGYVETDIGIDILI